MGIATIPYIVVALKNRPKQNVKAAGSSGFAVTVLDNSVTCTVGAWNSSSSSIGVRPLFVSVIYYLLMINCILFIIMGVDKNKAKKGTWRIKESSIFFIALIGGAAGGIAGMLVFHHKTRKPLFYFVFAFSSLLWIFLLWYLY